VNEEAALKLLLDSANRNGLLIEVGWLTLRAAVIPAQAPSWQLDVMREMFFAGAAHLFHSVLVVLDPGKEATEADLRRMGMIESELDAFMVAYKKQHNLP
jgi:hypothetical protein